MHFRLFLVEDGLPVDETVYEMFIFAVKFQLDIAINNFLQVCISNRHEFVSVST